MFWLYSHSVVCHCCFQFSSPLLLLSARTQKADIFNKSRAFHITHILISVQIKDAYAARSVRAGRELTDMAMMMSEGS